MAKKPIVEAPQEMRSIDEIVDKSIHHYAGRTTPTAS